MAIERRGRPKHTTLSTRSFLKQAHNHPSPYISLTFLPSSVYAVPVLGKNIKIKFLDLWQHNSSTAQHFVMEIAVFLW